MIELVNENTGYQVKFEFQVNKHVVFKCISLSVSQLSHGTYLY